MFIVSILTYLNGVGGSLVGSVSSEALGNRGVVRGADLVVDVGGRFVGDETGKLQVDGHVSEHELDGLVLKEKHYENNIRKSESSH